MNIKSNQVLVATNNHQEKQQIFEFPLNKIFLYQNIIYGWFLEEDSHSKWNKILFSFLWANKIGLKMQNNRIGPKICALIMQK